MSLNSDLIPESYNILIKNDEKVCNFSGKCTIVGTIAKKTSELILHSQDLSFTSDPLVNDSPWNFTFFTPKGENEECGVRLTPKTSGASLNAGQPVTITIDFTGPIVDGMAGYYRVNYGVLGSDEPRLGAMTQFEAAYARRAFPCIDEPSAKATFALTLEVPATYSTVLANMPSERDETVNNDGTLYRRVKFGVTPRMSTYLLAWIVGEYDHVAAVTEGNGGVRFRVFTPQGAGKSGEFALRTGVLALDYLAEFFGHDFPLPKQDMIAVREFAAGAMENWGLITYRESALLADKETSSSESLGRVSYVVAHELAHQWFGNLVSPSWWKQLWLNEGFATIVGVMVVEAIYPEQQYMLNNFLVSDVTEAMRLDALVSSHPIEVDVSSVAEIGEIFDAISYRKGGTVLRMCFERLGEPAVRAGLKDYLARHAYANATTEDLWECLSKASGVDVARDMDRWVKVTGYPLCRLSWDASAKKLRVQQQRFFSDARAYGNAETDDGQPWRFALPVVLPGGTTESLFVTEKDQTFDLPACPIVANDGYATMTRCLYDEETMPVYTNAAELAKLQPSTLLSLVSDAFRLAQAELLPVPRALDLVQSLVGTQEYSVLRTEITCFSETVTALCDVEDDAVREGKSAFVKDAFGEVVARLGWVKCDGESSADSQLRNIALKAVARVDKELQAEARLRLERYADGDASAFAPDCIEAVCSAVASSDKPGVFDLLRRVYLAEKSAFSRPKVLTALTSQRDDAAVRAAWEWCRDSGKVPANDFMYPFAGMRSAKNGELVWAILKEDFSLLCKRLSDAPKVLEHCVRIATYRLSTPAQLADVQAFAAEHGVPITKRIFEQCSEEITARSAFVAAAGEETRAYFREYAGKKSSNKRARR